MKITPCVYVPTKTFLKASVALLLAASAAGKVSAQNYVIKQDNQEYFEKAPVWNPYQNIVPKFKVPYDYYAYYAQKQRCLITPKGVPAEDGIVFPPSEIRVAGKTEKAGIVVDLNNNVLYRYDEDGKPVKAYLVASGKKSTPTKPGVRKVSHFEKYPYKGASKNSKRRKTPRAFGPKIICLNNINVLTGAITGSDGQFIHGNNNSLSIGNYASHGCIRMDNEAILEVVDAVSRGTYVVFMKK